jgi:hypothetical protein
MKLRLPWAFLFLCLPNWSFAQEVRVSGQIQEAQSGKGVAGAEIRLPTLTFFSKDDGTVEFSANLSQSEQITLTIFKPGFQEQQLTLDVRGKRNLNLGTIKLNSLEGNDALSAEEFVPVVTLSETDLDNDGEQNVSGLLTASNDIFVSAASFQFSFTNFRIRGYDGQHNELFFNGIPINDVETGFPGWNLWSGLNDVVRSRVATVGLAPNPYGFGGLGGITALDVRASHHRKQLRVSYAVSNRAYRNRVMATYSSGLLSSGWAFTVSASRRWAQEGYIDGTFYDANAYFLGVEKKLNANHFISFTALGSPVKRGRSAPAIQEMYDLAGTNYYNSFWGYQNGEKRNSRVQNTHQPLAVLRHDWQLGEKTRLTTALGYQTGRNGTTALDWYEARDPRPNYYRKLPSAIPDPAQSAAVAQLLRENETLRQIDWAALYNANRGNTLTINNANGIAGNSVTGKRSNYVLEERRFDRSLLSFNSNLETSLGNTGRLAGGISYQQQRNHNFKTINDLLGGDFYLDIDRFAEFLNPTGDPNFIQNDISTPNRILKVGDKFGWDFSNEHRRYGSWAQLEVFLPHFDLFLGANAGNTTFWRQGNVANGKFPDNSKGESEKQQFFEWGAKAGITYKLDGRNYFLLNGAYLEQAPQVRNAYVSPRTRDQVLPGLGNELISSLEGGYLLRAPYLKGRLIGYYTQIKNQNRINNFFLDNALIEDDGGATGGFVNYAMTGINTQHAGLEFGLEWAFAPGWRASTALAMGQYIYTSRPNIAVYLDNLASRLREDVAYIKNFYVPNMPQTAGTLGLSYNSPKFWFVNLNFNYFDRIYLDFNPDRRTVTAVAYVDNPEFANQVVEPGSPLWREIIEQERAPSAYTLDLFGGKSWKIRDVFLYLNVGVNNILDKQNFITGGFEQFRFDYEGKNVNRFPPNYFYSFGRNYFVSLAVRL